MRNIVKGGMLIIVISLFMAFIQSSESTWLIDINKAQEIAKEKDNVILMSFQGSDWCANCKRLEKILFSNADFFGIFQFQPCITQGGFSYEKGEQA